MGFWKWLVRGSTSPTIEVVAGMLLFTVGFLTTTVYIVAVPLIPVGVLCFLHGIYRIGIEEGHWEWKL